MKYAHTRKRDDGAILVGMVWDYLPEKDELGWRPALKKETPSGWAVWDSAFGWIVGF